MSLIKCSECGKEISDKAPACPSCGNPMSSVLTGANIPTEVELTKKRWKVTSLISILMLVVGLVFFANSAFGWGFFFIFVAFMLRLIAGFGAWWTNG